MVYAVSRCHVQDLPLGDGPLRLVLATDKMGSRSISSPLKKPLPAKC